MRKIEQRMIEAIKNGEGMKYDNTEVTKRQSTGEASKQFVNVMLHGSCIATVIWDATKHPYMPCELQVSLQGYNTKTTRSRLDAVLTTFSNSSGIVCKRGQAIIIWPDKLQYIGDEEIVTIELEVPGLVTL